MSRLKDQISSDYISAANKLKSKVERQRIVAYVESYDDVFFWRTVLSPYEDDRRYFEVMLPSKKNLSKGKKSALMNLLRDHVGQHMIVCVDADYDYLLQGTTPMSKMVIESPYVFHTYAYAIENMQCYAPSLHNICVGVTLNDHAVFDFEDFLSQYSEAIFPLFVWSIWFYRHNNHKFTISDFNQIIVTGNFRMDSPEMMIKNVRRKVNTRIQQFHREFPDAKESYLALKEELKALGVSPRDTYLYIQGHHLYDSLVVPMLRKVCDYLIKEREREIYRNAKHIVQKKNELSGYSHCMADINLMLRRNVGFLSSKPYQRLNEDLKNYILSLNFSSKMQG